MSVDSVTVTRPEILEQSIDETQLEYSLYIPVNLIYFKGHFPGKPILPGVTQIDWVLSLAKPLSVITEIKSLDRIKFLRPIRPSIRISLLLKLIEDDHCLNYRFFNNNWDFSSGRILFS